MTETETETESGDKGSWPSVDRAYEFVLPSYQHLAARFEAADNRIHTILAFASGFTLGIPVLAKTLHDSWRPASFRSPLFIVAMLSFAVLVMTAIVGRLRGKLRLIDPGIFDQDERWLRFSEVDFKRAMLAYAGQDFVDNQKQIWEKGQFANAMGVLFLLMVVSLLLWLIRI